MTIQKIAKLAGVSKSTVSRALNDSGYVNREVKEKILKIASETNYSKPRKQGSKVVKKNRTIAVVFPTFMTDFFGNLLEGILRVAEENNCGVMVFSSKDDFDREKQFLEQLKNFDIQGLLITTMAAYEGTDGWDQLQSMLEPVNIPVVLVDRNDKKCSFDSVINDNYKGAYMIGEDMARKKYGNIGAIIGDTILRLGHDRRDGFLKALEDNELSVNRECYLEKEKIITSEEAYQFGKQLIRNEKLPDTIFFSNDLIATGFMKALFENKVTPGEDICCMGFDYLDALNVVDFNYSYLERDVTTIGKIAMQMLLDRMQKNIVTRREYIVPSKLIHHTKA